jgi:flagellar basal-body rod protein FlgC
MSFREMAGIAGSAMAAQTIRLNTVASNLANAGAVAGDAETAYRARKPVFATVLGDAQGAQHVQVVDIYESEDPPHVAHEPGNPLADADGNVFYANVNAIEEMTDMLDASRAFQTNLEVLARVRAAQQELLRLGERG